jgi:hypothetical protein
MEWANHKNAEMSNLRRVAEMPCIKLYFEKQKKAPRAATQGASNKNKPTKMQAPNYETSKPSK